MNLEPIIQSKVSQKVKVLVTQSHPTLCNPIKCSPPARLLCPWNFPGKNTGVGLHFLLQVIFPIHGSNCHPCVSYIGGWILPLVSPGNPIKAWGRANKTKKLEWYEETGTAERYECIKFLTWNSDSSILATRQWWDVSVKASDSAFVYTVITNKTMISLQFHHHTSLS